VTERSGRSWLVLAAVAAGVFLLSGPAGLPALRLASKPVPAAALAVWVYRGSALPRARLIAAGLALSAVADAAIEASFLAGLAFFLLAHLAYIAGFLRDTRALALPRALPPALYGLGMQGILAPSLGPLRLPVTVYVGVICAMVWRAGACVGRQGRATAGEWAGLLGAILFAASDSLIAWNRFVTPLAWAPAAIILLYWAGQAGIAAAGRRP
jgi:uncharacterized membrane protein YhhN